MEQKIILFQGGTHGNFLERYLNVGCGYSENFDFFAGAGHRSDEDSPGAHNLDDYKTQVFSSLHPEDLRKDKIKNAFCYIYVKPTDLYKAIWWTYLAAGQFGLNLINHDKNFTDVFSIIDNAFWNFDVEDNAYVLMKSPKGLVAQLHSSATQWRHVFNLEITLERGSLILGGLLTGSKSYGDETLTVITSDPSKDKGMPKESTSKYNEDVSWDNEIKYFANSLADNTSIERGGIDDALETMKLIEAIYKADPVWKEKYYK